MRVRVEGDGDGGWVAGVPGAEVAEAGPRGMLVRLRGAAGPTRCSTPRGAPGTVTHFSLERPTLSDLFRQVVAA